MGEAARQIANDYGIYATASENEEIQKKVQDRQIESDFYEQEQFVFRQLVELESQMKEAVQENFEENGELLHALPYIGYLLDEMVSGDMERRATCIGVIFSK
jgi:hypothetical protein